MPIGSVSTTSSAREATGARNATGAARTVASEVTAGGGAAVPQGGRTSASGPDLRHMTPDQMWDYTWTLKESGRISDIDFAILNPGVFPWDPSTANEDLSTYLSAARSKPIDHVKMLDDQIHFTQTAGDKKRLSDLLDRIVRIANSKPVSVTI